MTTYFFAKDLLSPPTERAAFSDRQAYVCAELSRLAYFKFEGGNTLDELLTLAKEVVGDAARFARLEQKLRSVLTAGPSAAAEAEKAFGTILADGGFKLISTFSKSGTQAFICTRGVPLEAGATKNVAFLAFRGTEPRDFRDIKADINATLVAEKIREDTVEFHEGYRTSLRHIEKDINETLMSLAPDQLFITGHSLGGAIAVVFTRVHAASTKGACYTFGAPPVGAIEVQNGLKTPVYQIINEFDIVPNLPHPLVGKTLGLFFKGIRIILKAFTLTAKVLATSSWDEWLEKRFDMLTRFRHPGYVSYLVGPTTDARLRYNLGIYDKISLWFKIRSRGLSRFKRFLSDHSIDIYVDKLANHGMTRN